MTRRPVAGFSCCLRTGVVVAGVFTTSPVTRNWTTWRRAGGGSARRAERRCWVLVPAPQRSPRDNVSAAERNPLTRRVGGERARVEQLAIAFVGQRRRHNAGGLRLDAEPTAVHWPTRFEAGEQVFSPTCPKPHDRRYRPHEEQRRDHSTRPRQVGRAAQNPTYR